jgi:hypothetical protein
LERCGPETQRTFGFTGIEFIEGTLWERRLIDPAATPVAVAPSQFAWFDERALLSLCATIVRMAVFRQ